MKEISQKLTEIWDLKGYSMSAMVAKTGLGETTLRRVRAAESGLNLDTAVSVAKALDVSLDELTGLAPPKAEGHAEPAPPAQDVSAARLLEMYETRLAEQKERYESQIATTSALYERGIASGKKRELIKTVAIVILSIILAIYFLYFDVRNGGWGFVQYSSSRYSDIAPNDTSL